MSYPIMVVQQSWLENSTRRDIAGHRVPRSHQLIAEMLTHVVEDVDKSGVCRDAVVAQVITCPSQAHVVQWT